MFTWQKIEKDPFRIFFPLGAILALCGLAPWLGHFFGYIGYPRTLHELLMMNGFLLSFVCGFLMTAIPRFTGANYATRYEIVTVLTMIITSAFVAFSRLQSVNYLLSSFAIIFLASFAIRRFVKRTANPPHTFIFIGLGLVLWLCGNLGQYLSARGLVQSASVAEMFQDLFTNGAIMCLVLGVGGRVMPAILGWQDVVTHMRKQYETAGSFFGKIPFAIWASICVFLLSFLLEPFISIRVCFSLRGLVTLYFGIKFWRIFQLPKNRSYLAWGIWLSAWCLAVGYFIPAIWISQEVDALHFLLVGGFSLLTLLIAMRVSFAHSPAGTDIEKRSPLILIFAGLILLAMITRVTAIIWPPIYLDHLGYAAATWLVGLLLWGWLVVM